MKQRRRKSAPKADGTLAVEVRRLGNGEVIQVVSLEGLSGGLFTHRDKHRGIYCPGEGCRFPRCRENRRWRGYTPVYVLDAQHNHWLPFCLEITEGLELDLRHLWDRGQVWKISRDATDGKVWGGVHGVLSTELPPEQVPSPFPIIACLYRIYGTDQVKLSERNPMPLPVLLPPVVLAGLRDLGRMPEETPEGDPEEVRRRKAMLEQMREKFGRGKVREDH